MSQTPALSSAERRALLDTLEPYAAHARAVQGWSFERNPVPLDPPPPWDYPARARALLAGARRVLDMGTGGGEVFGELLAGEARSGSLKPPAKPLAAVSTEAWPPNVPVAARRLRPLGVAVVHADSLRLPFAAHAFDLVLNRHEELTPADVARVLAPGGRVLTQQVHARYHHELQQFFPRMPVDDDHEASYRAGFEAAGLRVIDAQHHSQRVAYRHLGDLVYLLVAAPWTIPDFNLEADLDALLRLERALRQPEGIVLSDIRYLIEAERPL